MVSVFLRTQICFLKAKGSVVTVDLIDFFVFQIRCFWDMESGRSQEYDGAKVRRAECQVEVVSILN